MNMLRKVVKPVAAVLVAAMTLLSAPIIPAQAAMVGTEQIIESSEATRDSDAARDKVSAFLAREDVHAELQKHGVSPEEAENRVAALSDAEIDRIAGRIDTLPAGEGAGIVGPIVGAFVLVFVVLLITDLIGLTDVFGFTRKGSLSPN
jgi:hypothetical protein